MAAKRRRRRKTDGAPDDSISDSQQGMPKVQGRIGPSWDLGIPCWTLGVAGAAANRSHRPGARENEEQPQKGAKGAEWTRAAVGTDVPVPALLFPFSLRFLRLFAAKVREVLDA